LPSAANSSPSIAPSRVSDTMRDSSACNSREPMETAKVVASASDFLRSSSTFARIAESGSTWSRLGFGPAFSAGQIRWRQ